MSRRRWITAGLGTLLGAAAVVGGIVLTSSDRTETGIGPVAIAQPLPFRPISFFNERCASCHGDYGAMILDQLARASDGELRRDVRMMVLGPAQATLTDGEIDALVAYHRSLADGTPFVAVHTLADGEIAGEATPGVHVRIRFSDRSILETAADGHAWRVRIPAELDAQPLLLELVGKSGKMTVLDLRTSAFSHAHPSPGG